MRHTDGKVVWLGTHKVQRTYPLNEMGARYVIARWFGDWVIMFHPYGSNEGAERVDWPPGKRTLNTAKDAVAAHWAEYRDNHA